MSIDIETLLRLPPRKLLRNTLRAYGLIIPVTLTDASEGATAAPVQGAALIDTGASFDAVDAERVPGFRWMHVQGLDMVRWNDDATELQTEPVTQSFAIRLTCPQLGVDYLASFSYARGLYRLPNFAHRKEPCFVTLGRDFLAQYRLVLDIGAGEFSLTPTQPRG